MTRSQDLVATIAVALALVAAGARASGEPISTEVLVQQADLVVLGGLSGRKAAGEWATATLSVREVLKGAPGTKTLTLRFLAKPGNTATWTYEGTEDGLWCVAKVKDTNPPQYETFHASGLVRTAFPPNWSAEMKKKAQAQVGAHIAKVRALAAAGPAFEQNGLAVYVSPASPSFTKDQPLVFTVTYRNTGKEALALYDAGEYERWKLTFTPRGGEKSAAWQPVHLGIDGRRPHQTATLPAGEAHSVEIRLAAEMSFTNGTETRPGGLPAGGYALALTFELGKAPQAGKDEAACWTGKVETKALSFEIAAPAK